MSRIFYVIRSLVPTLCGRLFWAIFLQPIVAFPTIWASVQAQLLADEFYPNNNARGIGNAFKHAIWNMLIIHKTKFYFGQAKASNWAKKITDLHEACVQNAEIDFLMDKHNNQVGRNLYQTAIENQYTTTKQLVDFAKNKADGCILIKQKKFFSNYPFDLVFV